MTIITLCVTVAPGGTMLAHGIPHLLTFNEAGFHRFNTLIEVVAP